MPSVSSLSQFTIINLGPLTTTWTAPQSCATQTTVYLAASATPDVAVIAATCGASPDENCYPGATTQIDEIYTMIENLDIGAIPYFSPGSICPDKYTTAGIAVKDGSGKLVSSSGLFAPTTSGTRTIGPGLMTYTTTATEYLAHNTTSVSVTTGTTTFVPLYNPAWNVMMEALAASETAVVCCPRYNSSLPTKELVVV
jgi:hypothetical protein